MSTVKCTLPSDRTPLYLVTRLLQLETWLGWPNFRIVEARKYSYEVLDRIKMALKHEAKHIGTLTLLRSKLVLMAQRPGKYVPGAGSKRNFEV